MTAVAAQDGATASAQADCTAAVAVKAGPGAAASGPVAMTAGPDAVTAGQALLPFPTNFRGLAYMTPMTNNYHAFRKDPAAYPAHDLKDKVAPSPGTYSADMLQKDPTCSVHDLPDKVVPSVGMCSSDLPQTPRSESLSISFLPLQNLVHQQQAVMSVAGQRYALVPPSLFPHLKEGPLTLEQINGAAAAAAEHGKQLGEKNCNCPFTSTAVSCRHVSDCFAQGGTMTAFSCLYGSDCFCSRGATHPGADQWSCC